MAKLPVQASSNHKAAAQANVEISIDAVGATNAFIVTGLNAFDSETVTSELTIRYRIIFEYEVPTSEYKDLESTIILYVATVLGKASGHISEFSISRGSTWIDFLLSFSGISLVTFFHQYKTIRSGVILASNDIRAACEWIARRSRSPQPTIAAASKAKATPTGRKKSKSPPKIQTAAMGKTQRTGSPARVGASDFTKPDELRGVNDRLKMRDPVER